MLEQIIVITCPRESVRQTLSTIQTDLPIILVMDSVEDYLPEFNWWHAPNIVKVMREPYLEEPTSFIKSINNYCRCLALAEGKNTLIIEDDIELHSNWREELERCVSYVERRYSEYVLSIGEHAFAIDDGRAGVPQLDYGIVREVLQTENPTAGIHVLGMTQGRYFPKTIPIKEIRDYVQQHPYATFPISYDLVLDICLFLKKIKLFVSQSPLLTKINVGSAIDYSKRI